MRLCLWIMATGVALSGTATALAGTEADIIGKWGASAQTGVYSCNASGDGVMRYYFSKGTGGDIVGHIMGGPLKLDVKITYVLTPTNFRGDGLTLKNKATGQNTYVSIVNRDASGKPATADWRPINPGEPIKTSLWMKRCGD